MGFQLEVLGTARTVEGSLYVERAEPRIAEKILERATGRLFQLEVGIHALGIEAQVELVIALTVAAARAQLRRRVLERPQMKRSANLQSHPDARELRPELEVVDGQLLQVDVRHTESGLLALGWLRRRAPLDVELRDRELPDPYVPHDEGERRPAQREVLSLEPHSAGIAQLQLPKLQCLGKAAGQTRELYPPAAETRRLALDQRSPIGGVTEDDNGRGEH